MRFTPMTDDEIKAAGLLEEGEYQATVVGLTEATSKAGDPMLKIDFTLYMPSGGEIARSDWFLTDGEYKHLGLAKLHEFCEATGLADAYKSGSLTEKDVAGKRLNIEISHVKSKKDGKVNANISGYFPLNGKVQTQAAPKADTFNDDDIPF